MEFGRDDCTERDIKDLIPIPKTSATLSSVEEYPLFIKPDMVETLFGGEK